jgi:hypothetical protein
VDIDMQGVTDGALLKVVDERGDLVAVLRVESTGRRFGYGCVVAPAGGA